MKGFGKLTNLEELNLEQCKELPHLPPNE